MIPAALRARPFRAQRPRGASPRAPTVSRLNERAPRLLISCFGRLESRPDGQVGRQGRQHACCAATDKALWLRSPPPRYTDSAVGVGGWSVGAFDRGCFRLSRSASEPAAQTESHRLQATSPAQQRAGPDSAGADPGRGPLRRPGQARDGPVLILRRRVTRSPGHGVIRGGWARPLMGPDLPAAPSSPFRGSRIPGSRALWRDGGGRCSL